MKKKKKKTTLTYEELQKMLELYYQAGYRDCLEGEKDNYDIENFSTYEESSTIVLNGKQRYGY